MYVVNKAKSGSSFDDSGWESERIVTQEKLLDHKPKARNRP